MHSEVENGQSYDLEYYNVEDAIKIVREVGDDLVESTKHVKHAFRAEWVDQLVARYRERPGKPIVHLSDLLDSTMVLADARGEDVLGQSWESFSKLPQQVRSKQCFRGIRDLVEGHPSRFTRLRSWKLYSALTRFDVNLLEPQVTRLRISGGRYMRTVEGPKLPFDLATISGARLIGYQGDTNSRNSAFTNGDPILLQDYEARVRDVVGDITITRTVSRHSGLSNRTYMRTNVGKLVTSLTSTVGFDNSVDQKFANNPLPLWLHLCSASLIAACISALWDAEGSVNFHDVKVSQAAPILAELANRIPHWPGNIPFGGLSPEDQFGVLKAPPLLLTSAAIFLRKLGVFSHLWPAKVSVTSTGSTSYWQHRIGDIRSIEHFRKQVVLMSNWKAMRLVSGAYTFQSYRHVNFSPSAFSKPGGRLVP